MTSIKTNLGRLGAALAVALLATLSLTSLASAHAKPDHATPAINGTVDSAPAIVEIWFGEEVKPDGLSLQVIGPGGVQVDNGDTKLDLFDPERKHVTVSLHSGLGPGTYTVQWTTVSADDGDAAQGGYTFTVVGGSPIASPAAAPVASPVATPAAAAVVAPSSSGGAGTTASGADGASSFDSHAFELSVGVGLAAAVLLFGFWRVVRPREPLFRS